MTIDDTPALNESDTIQTNPGEEASEDSVPWGPGWWKCSQITPEPETTSSDDIVRVADLFCGCGGFSLGVLEGLRHGGLCGQVALAADIDTDAREVYLHNIAKDFVDPSDPMFLSDPIETALGKWNSDHPNESASKEFIERYGHLDVLIGGPPCQGHSNLNNHTRRSDTRNELYYQMLHVARLARPKIVMIENVAAVKNSHEPVVSKTIKGLRELGYHATTLDVWAHRLGVAQKRRRLFVIAHRIEDWSHESWESFLPELDTRFDVMEAIEDLEDEPDEHKNSGDVFVRPPRITAKSKERIAWLFAKDENGTSRYDLETELRPPCHQKKDEPHRYKSMYGRIKPDEPAQTITTGFGSMGQGRFVHPTRERLITPHEAARIQGFPDFFSFARRDGESITRTALQRVIGNAVPPPVAAHLTLRLVELGALADDKIVDVPEKPLTKSERVRRRIELLEEPFTFMAIQKAVADVSPSTIRKTIRSMANAGVLKQLQKTKPTRWQVVHS